MTDSIDPSDSLYPIAVLIDELKNEDVSLRLNSVKRLETIAQALGPERTRQELIPFLGENHDDDDEVLLTLADELGKFVPLVGGAEYGYVLLPVLETLASVDETVVRQRATASLEKIAAIVSAKDVSEHFIPMIQRLMGKEWTARVSASQLVPCAYELARNDIKAELRAWFTSLSKDETPMVRRASAQAFSKFVKVVEAGVVEVELLPIFEQLTQDDQDSVRLISVEACGTLSCALKGKKSIQEIVIPVLLRFVNDQSWRVRHQAAIQMAAVANCVSRDLTRAKLLPEFVNILEDTEAEVRAVGAGQVSKFCQLIPTDEIVVSILPCCQDLVVDPSPYVRISLSEVIPELAPLLGKKATTDHLLPLFLELLRDECSDVRLGMIGKLDCVGKVIGVEHLSNSLLPAIEQLANDPHWRVRLAIISHVPLLAKQLGPEFLHKQLAPQCIAWLKDKVFSIREAAIETLQKLTEQFGSDWAKEHLLPSILEILKDSNYLYRTTGLHAIAGLAPHMKKDTVECELLPAVIHSSQHDPIPNVRFNGAKVLEQLSSVCDSTVTEGTIKACLSDMASDTDADVRYFAAKALRACEHMN